MHVIPEKIHSAPTLDARGSKVRTRAKRESSKVERSETLLRVTEWRAPGRVCCKSRFLVCSLVIKVKPIIRHELSSAGCKMICIQLVIVWSTKFKVQHHWLFLSFVGKTANTSFLWMRNKIGWRNGISVSIRSSWVSIPGTIKTATWHYLHLSKPVSESHERLNQLNTGKCFVYSFNQSDCLGQILT